ncbi:hypothetical protein RchiOBHm_Chr2g0157221 [Rosa chinensis]|uniref:Transmembrane protein n=1 Tax=Rosa chinensis TaxID=74649 RepID=A0A2P6S1S2_ROSCH|nr:hypothetical protein RchiOBHm_Chr2g0157221 [Rosa chinensis]
MSPCRVGGDVWWWSAVGWLGLIVLIGWLTTVIRRWFRLRQRRFGVDRDRGHSPWSGSDGSCCRSDVTDWEVEVEARRGRSGAWALAVGPFGLKLGLGFSLGPALCCFFSLFFCYGHPRFVLLSNFVRELRTFVPLANPLE